MLFFMASLHKFGFTCSVTDYRLQILSGSAVLCLSCSGVYSSMPCVLY